MYLFFDHLCESRMCARAKSLSRVLLSATSWTMRSTEPARLLCPLDSPEEYWSGLPCPPPGDLLDSVIEPVSLTSPELAGRFFTTSATWEAQIMHRLFF